MDVAREGGVEIGGGLEAGLTDDFCDAAVEALHHAVGLGVARRRQAVLGAELGAGPVEGVIAAVELGLAGEAVGELAAVVGEDFW